MRFRTKLFIYWGGVLLLVLIGTLWPVQRIVRMRLDKLTSEEFAGTREGLESERADRVSRIRQAGAGHEHSGSSRFDRGT